MYKQSFAIIFIILNIVFLYHTVNFVWGNHEWGYISNKMSVRHDFWSGRFSLHSLKQILAGGYILPVWTNLMSFFGLSLAAISLCYYWKLPKNLFLYCMAGLLFVLQTQICEILYYPRSLPDLLWASVYVISALILLEKVAGEKLIKKVLLIVVSVFLLLFTISMYQGTINTIAVVFLGKILIDLIDGESWEKRKSYILVVFCAFSAVMIYAIITILSKKVGIISQFYTTENLLLTEIPTRFVQVAVDSFHKVIEYKQYFFSKAYSVLFFILLLISILALVAHFAFLKENTKNKVIKIPLGLLLIVCVIIFANSVAILARNYSIVFYSPRVDFYSIPHMFVLFFIIIYKLKLTFFKNVALVLCIGILGICIIQNILFQKVLVQGLEAEKMLWQRVMVRIEDHPKFNPQNKYTVIQVGSFPSLRFKYYPGQKISPSSPSLLNYSFDPNWLSMMPIKYYYPTNFVKNGYNSADERNFKNTNFIAILSTLKEEILHAKAWPDKSSIMIMDDIMFVIADNTAQEHLKKYLQENINQ